MHVLSSTRPLCMFSWYLNVGLCCIVTCVHSNGRNFQKATNVNWAVIFWKSDTHHCNSLDKWCPKNRKKAYCISKSCFIITFCNTKLLVLQTGILRGVFAERRNGPTQDAYLPLRDHSVLGYVIDQNKKASRQTKCSTLFKTFTYKKRYASKNDQTVSGDVDTCRV